MSVDTKSNANDLDALSKQLAALREDMSRLTHTVTGIAGRRGGNMASDIAEGYDEAKHYVEKTGKSAEHQLEATVATHPLLAIGLAAGAGLLIGAMTRR
ncbi:DUF883 family protein [Pseudorhodobacter ferrugineus]|uniref:DUF883 family protein n=1 Tax=Pseudorhodobacter ferrugineus TaxID=77008 RepID=UPI000409DAF8|nr:DUF883 family protein [Pseudorhodobacter ferrugineus]